MIYDARTNPRGYQLTIQQWPRDSRIMAMARAMGYRIPAHAFSAPEATPARALLNHGVWRAWCPDCPFAAEDVWRGHPLFWCMRCGNLKAGRAWRPLIWPDNLAEIESALVDYPPPAQNWEPWGVPVDIKAEAEAWVEHAAVMVDPEHGLSDNDVGGEDDPETYTVPVLAVTNAVIASSDANVDKGDIRYFRQFLSADPAGSGYWLVSSSASAAAWVARATAVLDAIGSTLTLPVATGNKISLYSTNAGLAIQAAKAILYGNGGLEWGVADDSAGTNFAKIWHAGNDGSGSGLDADNLDSFTWKQGKTAGFSGAQALTTSYVDVSGVSISADRDGQWVVIAVAEFAVASTDGIASIKVVAGGSDVEEGFGAGAISLNASGTTAMDLVTVTGATTIKVQAQKASGSGGSTINYCKLIAFWLAP